MKTMVWLALLVLLVVSCASYSPKIVEKSTTLPMPGSLTPAVNVTATFVLTPSPMPPAAIPEVTLTPVYIIWSSAEVIQAFKDAHLEVGENWVMTKEDHGLDPIVIYEGTRFRIPSYCVDCSGRVFSFGDAHNLELAVAHYNELAKISMVYFSWLFVRDNILVQIHGSLPRASALEYETALQTMK